MAHPDTLTQLDAALLTLRRFFDPPASVPDGARRVESSTILVVHAVKTAGGEQTGGAMARSLGVSPSTATRLIDRATRAGMVLRIASAGRHTQVRLTPEGRALHERAVAYRLTRLAALTDGWTPGEVHTFTELLSRFAADATRPPVAGS